MCWRWWVVALGGSFPRRHSFVWGAPGKSRLTLKNGLYPLFFLLSFLLELFSFLGKCSYSKSLKCAKNKSLPVICSIKGPEGRLGLINIHTIHLSYISKAISSLSSFSYRSSSCFIFSLLLSVFTCCWMTSFLVSLLECHAGMKK